MKGTLPKLLVALAILWPYFSPASDVTNAPAEPSELISEVIPIKYAKASELASLLRTTNKVAQPFFNRLVERLTEKVGGDAIQSALEKMGPRQVQADERNNSLHVVAAKREMIALKEIIAKLDFALPQILIEAVIMEFVINDANAKHPIEVQPHPALTALIDQNLIVNTMFPFRQTNDPPQQSNDRSYLATTRAEIDETLTAMASNSRTRILFRPRVQTSEGEPAQFFIGESRPYPGPSIYAGGAFSYSSIQSVNEGVTLETTCYLQTNGLLQIELNKTTERTNGSVYIANVGSVPITTREETQAQVVVHDREVFLIGGYVQTNKVSVFSENKLLGRIPGGRYVNKLITYPKRQARRELVILVRATVLPAAELAAIGWNDSTPRIRPPTTEAP